MAGVLTLDQYLGGPDKIVSVQSFPSDQRTLVYNFQRDLTGWTIEADYQTIIVDLVQFNRFTGEPNFSKSKVIGSFAKVEVTGAVAPQVTNVALGLVNIHFPANMYTGPIIPDARKNVPIVIYSVTWRDNSPVAQTQTHRWALIQAWEPDVTVGDPTLAAGYTAFA
jgi:hypothetical protein